MREFKKGEIVTFKLFGAKFNGEVLASTSFNGAWLYAVRVVENGITTKISENMIIL